MHIYTLLCTIHSRTNTLYYTTLYRDREVAIIEARAKGRKDIEVQRQINRTKKRQDLIEAATMQLQQMEVKENAILLKQETGMYACVISIHRVIYTRHIHTYIHIFRRMLYTLIYEYTHLYLVHYYPYT